MTKIEEINNNVINTFLDKNTMKYNEKAEMKIIDFFKRMYPHYKGKV